MSNNKKEELIPIDDIIFVKEAIYDMPYHELYDIVTFIRNHEWEDIPESIKDYLEEWEEFIAENL